MVYSLAVNWKKNQKVNLSINTSDDGEDNVVITSVYVDDVSLSLDEVNEVEEWLENGMEPEVAGLFITANALVGISLFYNN